MKYINELQLNDSIFSQIQTTFNISLCTMGQDLYKNIRALSTEDDYVIDNALTDQWRHRIMGLRLSLERLKVSLLDLSDFATWQGAIKLLVSIHSDQCKLRALIVALPKQELLELQPVICRFNDISLKLPEDIKQAWEALTENVNLEAVHSGRSLRYFLQELVSALPWGSDSESQWVRTDHFERTVIIRPHEEFVIYVMLHEEWDCQVSIFTSTFDDIVAEEYRGWDERGDWEYIRMMLVRMTDGCTS